MKFWDPTLLTHGANNSIYVSNMTDTGSAAKAEWRELNSDVILDAVKTDELANKY